MRADTKYYLPPQGKAWFGDGGTRIGLAREVGARWIVNPGLHPKWLEEFSDVLTTQFALPIEDLEGLAADRLALNPDLEISGLLTGSLLRPIYCEPEGTTMVLAPNPGRADSSHIAFLDANSATPAGVVGAGRQLLSRVGDYRERYSVVASVNPETGQDLIQRLVTGVAATAVGPHRLNVTSDPTLADMAQEAVAQVNEETGGAIPNVHYLPSGNHPTAHHRSPTARKVIDLLNRLPGAPGRGRTRRGTIGRG